MAAQPAPSFTGHEILGALIDEALANGDIIPSEQATLIFEIMQTRYPREWGEYVAVECRRLIAEALRSALSSRRQRARRHHAAAIFGEAIASGDSERIGAFRLWRCRVDAENRQRCLGDMTKRDHEFVANSYAAQQHQQRMLESFHSALARKVPPGKTTAEVLDEASVMSLYDKLVGDTP